MVSKRGRDLNWGETPWDTMPRAELLRETQRLYAACVSMRSALELTKCNDPTSPFWGIHGTGGQALAMGVMALAPYPNEPAFRSFFRYAVDLLFPGLGHSWKVCDACHTMLAPCTRGVCVCGTTMRPLAWDDLKPKSEGDDA